MKENLNCVDVCMLLLLLAIAISTLQSDYRYESFWGNEGRYNGMFLWLIYGLAYFLISRLLKLKRWYLDLFLLAGIIACGLGIADFFGHDIMGFKINMSPSQVDSFTSTFGNINSYTAYVGMFTAVAFGLFCQEREIKRTVFYWISLVIGLTALITGKSDNSYLSLAVIYGVSPFFLFSSWRGLKRYVFSCTTFASIIPILGKMIEKIGIYFSSFFNILVKLPYMVYIVIALWVVTGLLYIVARNKGELRKEYRIGFKAIWAIMLLGVVCLVGYLLYDANWGGNGEKYVKLSSYLILNDEWGSGRGFAWRLSLEHFSQFSWLRKLFGYGADTFGILTVNANMREMINYAGVIFESAHNEYIQYLLTIGIVGTVLYLGFLGTGIYKMIRSKNQYALSVMLAVAAYAAQATINIAHPIMTPVMFTLLFVGMGIYRNGIVQKDRK